MVIDKYQRSVAHLDCKLKATFLLGSALFAKIKTLLRDLKTLELRNPLNTKYTIPYVLYQYF